MLPPFPYLQTAHTVFSSDHLEQVISQLSQAIDFAIQNSHHQCELLPYILSDLARMENHPRYLTERAYKWCSAICENYQNFTDGQQLLFLSLKIGFRHLNPESLWRQGPLIHTEHHPKLADIIFESGGDEAISDLLVAWTLGYPSHGPLNGCVMHLTLLHKLQPFSPRLQQAIISSVETIGYNGFKEVEVEAFVALLNSLDVAVKDVGQQIQWPLLLLGITQFSEAAQHLSHHYWVLLVELTILYSFWLEPHPTYNPQVMTSLKDAQDWDKLECWMGVVWMIWPPKDDEPMEKELECGMLLLFQQQPGAIKKLQQWMEQWSNEWGLDVPKSFAQICEEACLRRVQQDTQ